MRRTRQPPATARAASRIEHVDAVVATRLGDHHDHPAVAALGTASEIADQPPLIALSAATAAAGLLLRRPVLLRTGLRMLASELVATGIKTRIKRRIDRTRPHKMLEDGRYVREAAGDDARNDGPWSSFPSGHTAGAVAVGRALAREHPRLAVPVAVAAFAVAAVQLPRRAHFVTDVIAGAAVGWLAETLVSGAIRALGRGLGRSGRTGSSAPPGPPASTLPRPRRPASVPPHRSAR